MKTVRRLRITMIADRINKVGDVAAGGFNEYTTAEPSAEDIGKNMHLLMELYRLRCEAEHEEPDWSRARINVGFDTWTN